MIEWIKKKVKSLLKRSFPYFYRKLGNIKYRFKLAKYKSQNGRKTLTIYALGSVASAPEEILAEQRKLFAPADFCVAHLQNYCANQCDKLPAFGIDAFCVSKDMDVTELENPNLIREGSGKIFCCNEVKIGVIHFNSKMKVEELWEIIQNLKFKGAEYLLLYISYDVLDYETENLMKEASKHVNQVVGIGEEIPFHNWTDNQKVMSSIGSFTKSEHHNEEHACIILKNRVKVYRRRVILLERSYIPCAFDAKEGVVRKLCIHDLKDLTNRRWLSENIVKPTEEERSINLKKLFDILDLNIPKKFQDYLEWPVKKICVYPHEIENNSVLFLREYDPVVHEKDEQAYYNELIKKIYKHMRKGLIVVFSPIDLPKDIPHIKVESSMALHRTVCKYIVNLCDFDMKVAVTGSTGKTSAKEMIALVLAQKYKTFKNPGNENLQVKMGSMLQEFRPCYGAYVQEVGGGKIGGASSVSKMLEPDIGVITNIGYSHLRWSKTREQLAINKIGIADGIRNNGPLFINLDNDVLQAADVTGRNVITYAIGNSAADYRAVNICATEHGTTFEIVHNDVSVKCELNVPGEYNIYNALIGFGVGEYVGISHDKICDAIASFKTEGIRQTLIHLGGYNLFVDCYNAAPDSMTGAVATLAELGEKKNKRIAVLADMTGLEELSIPLHEKVGRDISGYAIDYLICYGCDSKAIYENYSNPTAQKYFFEAKEQVIETLQTIMSPGDYILFKGSSKFKLEQDIIDEVWGMNLSTIAHERKRKNLHHAQNLTYRLFPSFAHAYSLSSETNTIHILDSVKGKNVISIKSEAFADCVSATELILPQCLKNIQKGAFRNCQGLHKVILPNETKFIEDNSFENCSSLTEVLINEKLIHIGAEAFKDCKLLNSIFIPKNVTYIGNAAFDGCEKIEIICETDSYAERYAKENKLRVKCIERD